MRNLDLIRQENEQFRNQLAAAVQDGSPDAVAEAFTAYARHIEDSVIAEAQSLAHTTDASILASRGVRQLTGEERNYYCKVIDAMRSDNPRQALSSLDVVLPKTTIDAVFGDLTNTHPLLDAINFQNTSGLVEIIVNTGSKQLATWSALSSEIVKELTGGFKKIGMEHNKLAAFLPVCKAMLDLGPEWLDRYVRTLLSEAIYLGLEESIINGTGKDMPIGMNRQVGDGVTVTGGVYPEKETVELTSLDPITYGILLSGMSTTPNGNSRVIESVLMIVNPKDYLTKIMPATTVRGADGTFTRNVFPFPTTVIQSVQVPEDRAIIGLGDRYFMGIGTAKSGKIEYSDEYRFLEDERVYLVKLYGHGEPLDNNAFVYADISGLTPYVQEVTVTGTVNTKEQT
ncbi:phage major capsid protein [Butyricicoccus porcorum]|uniref:Phage major capsid protein n=1 Tax=Butyricicoccus porcorum TaxID=1945634 RepID=A0A252F2K9_9FIRM|nr:phage major capsid protein [Butyricicoccus porcorum]OUM20006.1 phage major capsid protein [Butyricicoccus porcorum]